ncbi:MAG: hypothetical protein AMJ92_07425 [candidate division Zixibacteria bacterium SM23_81]|nr:MAG: hypothetical protein AMJ92_07425 [candidate division Zixibacteria bacterium SM23_81]
MRKTSFSFLILALICFMSVNPALAGDSSGGQEIQLRETEKSESSQGSMNVDFSGIGGKIGLVDPDENIKSTVGFGLHVDLGTITPTLRLEGNLDYWSKSQDSRHRNFPCERYNRDLSFGLTVKHALAAEGSIIPYAGGGFGFHLVREEREFSRDAPYDDWEKSGVHPGLHGIGGVEGRFSPQMRGDVEIRYTINDPSNFGIFFGVMYSLKR